MFYHFEIQMVGVIILPVMLAVGLLVWFRRRRADKELSDAQNDGDSLNI